MRNAIHKYHKEKFKAISTIVAKRIANGGLTESNLCHSTFLTIQIIHSNAYSQ